MEDAHSVPKYIKDNIHSNTGRGRAGGVKGIALFAPS